MRTEFMNDSKQTASFNLFIGIRDDHGRQISLPPGERFFKDIEEDDPWAMYEKIIWFDDYDNSCQAIKLIKRAGYKSPPEPRLYVDVVVPPEYRSQFHCPGYTIKIDQDRALAITTNIPFEVSVPSDSWLVQFKKVGLKIDRIPTFYDHYGRAEDYQIRATVKMLDRRSDAELKRLGAIFEKEIKRFEE